MQSDDRNSDMAVFGRTRTGTGIFKPDKSAGIYMGMTKGDREPDRVIRHKYVFSKNYLFIEF